MQRASFAPRSQLAPRGRREPTAAVLAPAAPPVAVRRAAPWAQSARPRCRADLARVGGSGCGVARGSGASIVSRGPMPAGGPPALRASGGLPAAFGAALIALAAHARSPTLARSEAPGWAEGALRSAALSPSCAGAAPVVPRERAEDCPTTTGAQRRAAESRRRARAPPSLRGPPVSSPAGAELSARSTPRRVSAAARASATGSSGAVAPVSSRRAEGNSSELWEQKPFAVPIALGSRVAGPEQHRLRVRHAVAHPRGAARAPPTRTRPRQADVARARNVCPTGRSGRGTGLAGPDRDFFGDALDSSWPRRYLPRPTDEVAPTRGQPEAGRPPIGGLGVSREGSRKFEKKPVDGARRKDVQAASTSRKGPRFGALDGEQGPRKMSGSPVKKKKSGR
ncbi:hypothetical protein AMPC_37450 [Anaeromyxobacter paludicola]|uniref:Uncharacterized protein n=1 Tax=Anaeromyxobacter paludicola TaxID=2918171 RepID=A0ABN6NBK5_9BACT|nr:hypothetical protein AMPC_37450 [Anaeromyxobacter paludicola]